MSTRRFRLQRRARTELGDYPVELAWAPDGKAIVIAGGEGAIFWYGVDQPAAAPQPIGRHAGGALSVTWQPAGPLFASSGQDGEVLLWDSRTRTSRPIHSGADWPQQLAFSGDGRQLAVASGRQLHLFDTEGQAQQVFGPHPGTVAALAWRPRRDELAAVFNGGARIYAANAAAAPRDLPWPGAALTACWSPDGRVLAAGMQDGAVHFWYVDAGSDAQMRGYASKVTLTGWSANGRYLATAAEALIVLWDFSGSGPEGTKPLQLAGHNERVTQLACQPVGAHLASGSRDCRLLLWQPAQGGEPVDADLLAAEVVALRWSRDGQQLAAADRNGGLSVYALER